MDLSLALGRPLDDLTERDFARWSRYARRRMLPQRRIELYLAQIAMLIAQTMGGSNSGLSDFLFDPKPEPNEIDVEEVRKAFGYKPSKRMKRG